MYNIYRKNYYDTTNMMYLAKVLGIWLYTTCIANIKHIKKEKFYLLCIPKVVMVGDPLLLYFTAKF